MLRAYVLTGQLNGRHIQYVKLDSRRDGCCSCHMLEIEPENFQMMMQRATFGVCLAHS
jgi:hypothetical protein